MKMTDKIEGAMFAPCGMNCMVCYKHCFTKKTRKPCMGCFASEERGKPEHCRKCRIKDCAKEKDLRYCYQCADFPCKLIKNLERSYNKRYDASLIANSRSVEEVGLETFMKDQREAYTCPQCGGVFSIHDKVCTECGEPRTKG